MGCAELLLHTWDVAEGRGLDWAPPTPLADAVVTRLFPWAPADADPWAALLWATGRGELPGREPVTSWRWHCAPLSEWDGHAAPVTSGAACRRAPRRAERGVGGFIEGGLQKLSGHHGVTGQRNAVAAWVTAPGLISVTRPAACSVASDSPPR